MTARAAELRIIKLETIDLSIVTLEKERVSVNSFRVSERRSNIRCKRTILNIANTPKIANIEEA